jgi:DNA-directed RNA polymerase subunit RPC12/RpoP
MKLKCPNCDKKVTALKGEEENAKGIVCPNCEVKLKEVV